MAIDTLSKRVSALRQTLPIPDGTMSQGDRQHVLWQYSGILAIELILYIVIHGTASLAPWIAQAAVAQLDPWLVSVAPSDVSPWLSAATAEIEDLTP
jgi:hypothetical protein